VILNALVRLMTVF